MPAKSLDGVATPGQVLHIPESSTLLQPTLAFARHAAEMGAREANSFSTYYFKRLLERMVIGAAVEQAAAPTDVKRGDLRRRALSVIQAQLADPDLKRHSLAADLGFSLRHLQRVFRAEGTTVERQIRKARVDHAARLLTDPAYDALSIAQIARHAGFSNGSSLARAFGHEGRG